MVGLRSGVGLVVLICAAGWAQSGDSPTGIFAEDLRAGSTVPYDQMQWKVIKQTKATFDAKVGPANVVLLLSLEPTSSGGAGQPLNDVKLLILRGERVIYDFVKPVPRQPNEIDKGFYVDDYLDIVDVTDDGVPQVLFHSGFQGASDHRTLEHILRYDKAKASFKDVAPEYFSDSAGEHGFRWLRSKGRSFAVIAERNWPSTGIPEDRCHYCRSPFQYDAYRWNKKTASFLKYRHLYGKASYEDTGQALNDDWVLIQSALNP